MWKGLSPASTGRLFNKDVNGGGSALPQTPPPGDAGHLPAGRVWIGRRGCRPRQDVSSGIMSHGSPSRSASIPISSACGIGGRRRRVRDGTGHIAQRQGPAPAQLARESQHDRVRVEQDVAQPHQALDQEAIVDQLDDVRRCGVVWRRAAAATARAGHRGGEGHRRQRFERWQDGAHGHQVEEAPDEGFKHGKFQSGGAADFFRPGEHAFGRLVADTLIEREADAPVFRVRTAAEIKLNHAGETSMDLCAEGSWSGMWRGGWDPGVDWGAALPQKLFGKPSTCVATWLRMRLVEIGATW